MRFLSTPYYQLQFCRTGLWLPSQTALTTEDGLKEWMSPEVHPAGYEQMVTTYLPKYGHVLYMPPGYPKTNVGHHAGAGRRLDRRHDGRRGHGHRRA